MKKYLITAIAILCVSANAWSYGDKKDHEGRDGMEFMTRQLNLTADQQQQIAALKREQKDKARHNVHQMSRGLMALDPGDADYDKQLEKFADEQSQSFRASIIERGQYRARLYRILTPEQRESYRNMMQNIHEHHPKGMNKGMEKGKGMKRAMPEDMP